MITKAIIPVAGLGTRFLPLSKTVPKEFWPLIDKPIIQYIVKEVKDSKIKELVFVVNGKNKLVLDYFKEEPQLEEKLKERKKEKLLTEIEELKELCSGLSFSWVLQKEPLGDGHAILQAKKIVGDEACAVSFADDVVEAKEPCLSQLIQIFKTCQKPVLALARVAREKLSHYGVVEVEKIAQRVYKIKGIIEKPEPEKAPSDLAIVGKYILTPDVFEELKKAKPSKERGEIILAEVLARMLEGGKVIYGYEFKGKWLECGNKTDWLCSHFYLSLKHPQFGPELRKLV